MTRWHFLIIFLCLVAAAIFAWSGFFAVLFKAST
jgi:hypothetical protein